MDIRRRPRFPRGDGSETVGTYGGVIAVLRHARPFAAALLVIGVLLAPAMPARAQDDRSDAVTTLPAGGVDGGGSPIVPDPFSGAAPDDNGDRGGAAQLALFGVLMVGLGLTAGRVVTVARRADRDRAPAVDGATERTR